MEAMRILLLLSLIFIAGFSPSQSPIKTPSQSPSVMFGEIEEVIVPLQAPVNTVAPVASGTGASGETLSCTTGTWDNSPDSYAYQWRADTVNIGGATSSTYVLTSTEEGTDVDCNVTATNTSGSSTQDSNDIAIAATIDDMEALVEFRIDATNPNSIDTSEIIWKNVEASPQSGASQTDYDFAISGKGTFSGTVGMSDYNFDPSSVAFLSSGTNPAFIKSMTKDVTTQDWWVAIEGTSSQPAGGQIMVGTQDTSGGVGLSHNYTSDDTFATQHQNGATETQTETTSTYGSIDFQYVFTRDASADFCRICVNGSCETKACDYPSTVSDPGSVLHIASHGGGTAVFEGVLDQIMYGSGFLNETEANLLFASAASWHRPFDIANQTDQTRDAEISSDIILADFISGSGNAISISANNDEVYRICSNSDCSSVTHAYTSAGGLIDENEYFQVKVTAASGYSTTRTGKLTIDGVKDYWQVTTEDPPPLTGLTMCYENTSGDAPRIYDFAVITESTGLDVIDNYTNVSGALTGLGDLSASEYGTDSAASSNDSQWNDVAWNDGGNADTGNNSYQVDDSCVYVKFPSSITLNYVKMAFRNSFSGGRFPETFTFENQDGTTLTPSETYSGTPSGCSNEGSDNYECTWTFTEPLASPSNTVAPVASGSATEGSELSCTTGTWTGNPTPSYTYQWESDGVDIAGATSSTFTSTSSETGTAVTCDVTATNSEGSATATSNSINVVAPSSATTYNGFTLYIDNNNWTAIYEVNMYDCDDNEFFQGLTGSASNNVRVYGDVSSGGFSAKTSYQTDTTRINDGSPDVSVAGDASGSEMWSTDGSTDLEVFVIPSTAKSLKRIEIAVATSNAYDGWIQKDTASLGLYVYDEDTATEIVNTSEPTDKVTDVFQTIGGSNKSWYEWTYSCGS